ncbi:AAA family ATPase [Rhizobium phaseoli]|uniref:DUF3696 domain-containing protein n=1 Tax=Rhizobium phaseoli TaxID=396 RepID=A0A7X6F9A4_9HYPH|nr:DUF3696 domain-containing protein [Rhizobium phaseoli]NKF14401.1 DUF3696 domain-containing protein [Rhizobium phaseoli]QPK09803.1 DUF3696 domain-containing protein [Rhizobium phaseoli]
MLKRLDINGYKSLVNISLELASLNVLVGANASGKSSVLQSLLLLRQSEGAGGYIERLALGGPLYEAGTARDILHPKSGYQVKMRLDASGRTYRYAFNVNRDASDGLSQREIRCEPRRKAPTELTRRGHGFVYLNAERLGPRTSYSLSGEDKDPAGAFGKHGEYTPSVLAKAQATEIKFDGWDDDVAGRWVSAALQADNFDRSEDFKNTQGRVDLLTNVLLSWIIPGSRFECQELVLQDLATLSYQIGSSIRSSVRPTHIGFGLSYTLPIIAGALSLNRNGVMIVENPEAHLHPFSQSRLGMFLAMIAAAGRQIFIETHSDHVVNGIRLATKFGVVQANEIFLNHFTYDFREECTVADQIRMDQKGKVSSWPRGFFDQIESDLSKL